jgi:enterochelin esterase-like enzyme
VRGSNVSYLVWVPPGYDQQTNRYPVIYWLHGMGGNQRGGATMFVPHVADAIKAGTLPPVIVVLINGMVKSFYCDSSDGQCPMESVIIKDLIPHVDETYRTIARREGRVIEGYSMGGYGAWDAIQRRPDLFAAAIPICGGGDTATATKLKDLLDTERELARVRTDIETMLGHKRFLDNRISLSFSKYVDRSS